MAIETSPDGAQPDVESWLTLLVEAVVKQELEDLDRPHVIVTWDLLAGTTFVTGPFADAASALAAAARELAYDRAELGNVSRRHEILPLLHPAPVS
ncbi:hypothetical protein P5P86_10380 [Nocardioides sp. BP30]|uniref:hypothetical protein n=1 Tax=Nocardioides sp. BP30 TaxID=3036374 RepID=UPI00246993AA|nr:hypothetical protein [Nocardioides sp. BP30]WGL50374.1 hypothetical protein P5P86_10380 [Nocardioides sp. BP30]